MRPLNSLPLTPPILHIRWGFFFPAFTGRAKLGSLADLGWPSALTLWPGVNVICTGSFFFFFPLTIRIIDTVEIWFWLITFFFYRNYYLNVNEVNCYYSKKIGLVSALRLLCLQDWCFCLWQEFTLYFTSIYRKTLTFCLPVTLL